MNLPHKLGSLNKKTSTRRDHKDIVIVAAVAWVVVEAVAVETVHAVSYFHTLSRELWQGEVSRTADLLSLLVKTRLFSKRKILLCGEMQLIPN